MYAPAPAEEKVLNSRSPSEECPFRATKIERWSRSLDARLRLALSAAAHRFGGRRLFRRFPFQYSIPETRVAGLQRPVIVVVWPTARVRDMRG